MPPPGSWVFLHFERGRRPSPRGALQWEERNCCTLSGCEESYSLTTSATVLAKHLATHNISSPATVAPASSSSSSSSSLPSLSSSSSVLGKRARNQSTLDSVLVKLNNTAVRPAFAALFARCSWAHAAIEYPEFIEALNAYRHSTIKLPDRRGLREDQAELAQRMRKQVVGRLRNYCQSFPLTIAIDGWTNVRRDKVTNVVILCGGIAYYWCSIVNVKDRNTAAWMRGPLTSVLNDIKGHGLMFSALVSDNEEANKALHRELVPAFPFLIRQPCAAHLIQLCVLKALELPSIEPTVLTMEALLGQFRYKVNKLKLKNLQMAACNGAHLCLIRPCDTRWSSHLFAAQRLLKLRSFVDMVFQQTPQFWAELAEIVRFLEPFQEATDLMQSDAATLYDMYNQFKQLLRHVRCTPSTSHFHSSIGAITNIIVETWEKHVNLDAVVISAQLSFDSSVDTLFPEKIMSSRRWFHEFAAQYALYWGLSTASTIEALREEAVVEWANFMEAGFAVTMLGINSAGARRRCGRLTWMCRP
jgi:hypothetical protein